MSKYERTSTLVNRKFYHYLIPTILSNVAMSLNEFVDSILVSHLLGIDAVGMVNRMGRKPKGSSHPFFNNVRYICCHNGFRSDLPAAPGRSAVQGTGAAVCN